VNTKEKTKIFVAMSGGVDSSVAAVLLKQQGYDLVGCFIKGWYPKGFYCSWKEDRRDAMRVCAKLGIPFITINAEKEYKHDVVDYMLREYKAGRTPNPDVMCNKNIKFGIFLKKALATGADYIATGHYVRCGNAFLHPGHKGKGLRKAQPQLLIAKDLNKDQSYFLWTLTQKQLQHCLFPIGDLAKPQVRELARKNNLPTAGKDESMGVCFIGEFPMADFLKKYIKPKKGKVITIDGKVIGEHEGVAFYTIGQRHGGFSAGGGVAYYIVAKDMKKNLIIVADKASEEKFYKKEVEIENVNWTRLPTPEAVGNGGQVSKTYKARIRYRQPLQTCKVRVTRNAYRVIFTKPQRAVTPGQSLVIYDSQTMLGGGIIK
jgi:tRNA-specific 2-thiouridylase